MNRGNAPLPSGFKSEVRDSVMQDRIGFESDDTRREFFSAVREASGASNWEELAEMFGRRRNSFQLYQYGKLLLPRHLFDSMILFLPNEKQNYFQEKILAKPGNWGTIKGGENNYAKNSVAAIKRLREGFARRDIIHLGRNGNPLIFDSFVSLSDGLCELIGAIIGDGCVDSHIDKNGNSNYHMMIAGDSRLDKEYLLEHLSSLLKNLFGIHTKHYFRKDQNALNLSINSKYLFTLLTKRFGFPAGEKTYTIKIPDEIIASKKEFIFATIRGIFDTDGCVFFDQRKPYKDPYPRITLQIASEPLFSQLKDFLSKYFSLYTHYNAKREIYSLEVYGHEQMRKWVALIGFSNKRHLNKIEEKYKPLAGIGPAI